MKLHFYIFQSCFMFILPALGKDVVSPQKISNHSSRLAFLKVPGSTVLVPVLVPESKPISSVKRAISGGYPSARPRTTTSLPPLAEFVPDENLEKELDESLKGVFPQKEAELSKRPSAIGLETEEEKQSMGITPPFPKGVKDSPDYELNPSCTGQVNCLFGDAIPGMAGIDYPIYATVPKTKFKCPSMSGYYGDIEARCQAFHVCLNMRKRVRQYSFLCPNGTIFSQEDFVCVWWHDFNCATTPSLTYLNKELNWDDPNMSLDQKMTNLKKMTKLGDDPRLRRINAANFPQQLLPALSVRLPNSNEKFGLLQSSTALQVSASVNSRTRTESHHSKSESEAYEEKEALGFIVNRGPGKKSSSRFATGDEPFKEMEAPDSVHLAEPKAPSNPPYLPPRANYLPPLAETTESDHDQDESGNDPLSPVQPERGFEQTTQRPITANKPKLTYLPPQRPLPPIAETTPDSNYPHVPKGKPLLPVRPIIDFETTEDPTLIYLPPKPRPHAVPAPDFPEFKLPSESRPNPVRPEKDFVTSPINPPIKASQPKLTYLPPKTFKSGAPDKGFDDPAFKIITSNRLRRPYTPTLPPPLPVLPPVAEKTELVSNKPEFDAVALFFPNAAISTAAIPRVTTLQKEILQNGVNPGPVESLRAVTYSVAPPPSIVSAKQAPQPQIRLLSQAFGLTQAQTQLQQLRQLPEPQVQYLPQLQQPRQLPEPQVQYLPQLQQPRQLPEPQIQYLPQLQQPQQLPEPQVQYLPSSIDNLIQSHIGFGSALESPVKSIELPHNPKNLGDQLELREPLAVPAQSIYRVPPSQRQGGYIGSHLYSQEVPRWEPYRSTLPPLVNGEVSKSIEWVPAPNIQNFRAPYQATLSGQPATFQPVYVPPAQALKPPQPHLAITHENFQLPSFNPRSTKYPNYYPTRIPLGTKTLPIPESSGPPELIRAVTVFAKTYISPEQNGRPQSSSYLPPAIYPTQFLPSTNAIRIPNGLRSNNDYNNGGYGRSLAKQKQIIRLPSSSYGFSNKY